MAKCSICIGTGICQFCNGTGDDRGNNPHPSPYNVYSGGGSRCIQCAGSGKCIECRGFGEK